MSSVSVYSYTHSITYVSDNILKSIKDIIRLSGLSPANFAGDWTKNLNAIKTWIQSGHLERVVLEIYNPETDELIKRWDLDIIYNGSSDEENIWTDIDQLKYHIRKAGVAPCDAKYELIYSNKPDRPDVEGFSPTEFRSTEHLLRQSLGSTIEHRGLGANASYWRQAC